MVKISVVSPLSKAEEEVAMAMAVDPKKTKNPPFFVWVLPKEVFHVVLDETKRRLA